MYRGIEHAPHPSGPFHLCSSDMQRPEPCTRPGPPRSREAPATSAQTATPPRCPGHVKSSCREQRIAVRSADPRSGTASACLAVIAAGTVLDKWRRQRMASLAPVWLIPALPGHQTEIRPLAGYTHRTSVNLAVLRRGTACVRLIVAAAGIVPGTRTSVVLVSLVPARVG